MGPLLTSAHVLEMRRRGVSFGAHSRTHRRLVDLSDEESRAEVCGCKAEIEHVLGEPVTTFAYPFGLSSPAVRKAVAACGYVLAVAVDNGSEERFNLRREPVGVDDTFSASCGRLPAGEPLAPAARQAPESCQSENDSRKKGHVHDTECHHSYL